MDTDLDDQYLDELDEFDDEDALLVHDRIAQDREDEEASEEEEECDRSGNELDLISEDETTGDKKDGEDDQTSSLSKELERLKLAEQTVDEDILRVMKEIANATTCLLQADPRIAKAPQPPERTKPSSGSIYSSRIHLKHFASLIHNGLYYIGLESDFEIDMQDDDVGVNTDCEVYFSGKDIVLVVKPPVIDSLNVDIYQPKSGRHLTLVDHTIDEIDIVTQSVSFQVPIKGIVTEGAQTYLNQKLGFDPRGIEHPLYSLR